MKTIKELQSTAYSAMKDDFSFTSAMQAPKITKVTISTGVGKWRADKRKMEVIVDRLTKISGQKPVGTKAKKSIATFKVREGEVTGYKVSLSGDRALDFVNKLVHVTLPRTKDFRGIKKTAVDEMGNLTIGVKEHIIFPETGDEELRDVFGLAITIGTTASDADVARSFFAHIGIPFEKEAKTN